VTAPGLRAVQQRLRALADDTYALKVQRFYKCGRGEYGEGDVFLGLRVPIIRQVVRDFQAVSLSVIHRLLCSRYHEERMCALLIMVWQFDRASVEVRQQIYSAYLANTDKINNWDLVDCSAAQIVGAHLLERDRSVLQVLARSADLWERRIAMVACFCFIRNHEFDDALLIAEMLLQDDHDLIHKAVGWMLREVGKRDQSVEMAFLDAHYTTMPRVTLRYAIERFPEPLRQQYLKGLRTRGDH